MFFASHTNPPSHVELALEQSRPPAVREMFAVDKILVERQVGRLIIRPNRLHMAVDEPSGLDDVAGVGDIATLVGLPDGLVCWLPYDAVLTVVGLFTCGEERGSEEVGVGVAEPDCRGGFGLGLGFLGVVGGGVLEVDEDP